MKKILSILVMLFAVVALTSCSRGPVLYVLNWNEYINEDLVSAFEDEYGVRVVIDPADSNESMYTKIKSKTTNYDIAIPSDYMVHKLYNEGLLHELNMEYLPNYVNAEFDPILENLRDGYFANNKNFAVPYFWGTLGVMYNTRVEGIEELVTENDWEVFFNSELTSGLKVSMYNSSRDALAVAQLHLDIDVNTKSDVDLKSVEDLLKAQNYSSWGTDDLKTFVANGNTDIALVYSGDFFDILYASMESEEDINYDLHVPTTNNVWFDAMVIPTTSSDVVMAHNFINFMIDEDNALENAFEIGYCPTLKNVYEAISIDPDYVDLINDYPYYPGIVTEGYVYKDLGVDVYQKMEIILSNVKG
ncbi:MAG: extracellular solute-binding protein [Bacilli bacterium]